jgi:hypothetical protein
MPWEKSIRLRHGVGGGVNTGSGAGVGAEVPSKVLF